ncbi:MAG: hypothetical protein COV72_05105 [Candidatus Omnitrophica bacterium CG11_big_fil_rev_8_21_14_0_20_42_13]|uniref:HD-GYP domain-containing protein n=1 Tax=Candidatus Ghiorseimicrobium undicola TaxID=1974746 RepID=A0A2H0LXD0_9BACT|nr:MAG: hypothetical protein COV72_05105 [Candidatus Omnitrophica bacterium CG11_big_fil_rev_8_21_14_0_20_42_13]
MAEGKVLVISEEHALCYHAKKDLTREDFSVTIEPEISKAISLARMDNFDVIIVSSKDVSIEQNKLLQDLKKERFDSLIIAVTDNYSYYAINNMLQLGIFDFLPESFEPKNLFLVVKQAILFKRVKNNIMIHEEKIINMEKQISLLSKKVDEGVKNSISLYSTLQESYVRSIKALAQLIDMRDKYTYSHSENVTKYAVAIAENMSLSFQEVKDIRDACGLHDIGKIGIRDAILTKDGKLSPDEWILMKQHPEMGARILRDLDLKNIAELVKEHHENFDGSGYPAGKKGRDILLGARIISLADAYDAMTSERSYRNIKLSKESAIEEIKRNSGSQFDPKVVEVFLKIIDNLV